MRRAQQILKSVSPSGFWRLQVTKLIKQMKDSKLIRTQTARVAGAEGHTARVHAGLQAGGFEMLQACRDAVGIIDFGSDWM